MEFIPAAPIPAIALAIINIIIVYYKLSYLFFILANSPMRTVAAPHNTDPNKNNPMPNMRIHLRPKISENLENNGSFIKGLVWSNNL
jgi:hypothetical protein